MDNFYLPGSQNAYFLTPGVVECLSTAYGKPLSRFGKKKTFIQEAVKNMKKKGTVGSFTAWCKHKGYPSVTPECINEGKKSKNLRTRRRAVFAQNIRHTSFGGNLLYSINRDISYLLR
jgi:hypothetical protein